MRVRSRAPFRVPAACRSAQTAERVAALRRQRLSRLNILIQNARGDHTGHFFSLPVHLHSGQTESAGLSHNLTDYCVRLTVEVVPFNEVQEESGETARRIIHRDYAAVHDAHSEEIADKNAAKPSSPRNPRQVASRPWRPGRNGECVRCRYSSPLIGFERRRTSPVARKSGRLKPPFCPMKTAANRFTTPRHPRTRRSLKPPGRRSGP